MNEANYLSAAIAYLDDWFEVQKRNDVHTPGYSVAISFEGEVIFKKGYGYAHREVEEKMTPDHLFRIASHSKSFTAVAIMQLMEAGKLKIYDMASEYLPFLKEASDARLSEITIQQILCHASGMGRDGEDASFWRLERDYPEKDELIAYLTQKPLIIEHNTRFKYSNFAYALLGWIIEEVSGQTYADYMKEHIFAELDSVKLGTEYDPKTGPYIVGYTGLTPSGKYTRISAAIDTKDIAAATGFFGTAESLCAFYSAVIPGTGKLLADSQKHEMLRQQWEIKNELLPRGYGLGLECYKYGLRELRGHSGGMPGNLTRTLFDPEEQIVVSILTNSHAAAVNGLQNGVWHILDFFRDRYKNQSVHHKFANTYYSMWETTRFVAIEDMLYATSLQSQEPFEACSELTYESNDTFKIVKESGFGSYGHMACFEMDDGIPVGLDYGGYPMYSRERYEQSIADLNEKFAETV